MSVFPSQNRTKPSPVPGPSTDTWASGLSFEKFSATSCEMGKTVDEPETLTEPVAFEPPSVPLVAVSLFDEHAAATIVSTVAAVTLHLIDRRVDRAIRISFPLSKAWIKGVDRGSVRFDSVHVHVRGCPTERARPRHDGERQVNMPRGVRGPPYTPARWCRWFLGSSSR